MILVMLRKDMSPPDLIRFLYFLQLQDVTVLNYTQKKSELKFRLSCFSDWFIFECTFRLQLRTSIIASLV